MTDIGLLAFMPVKSRNTNKAGKDGARAQAIVKIVKSANVPTMMGLRPKVSERGPNSSGPTTYPTRYIEIGKILTYEDVMSNFSLIYGIALDGREDPMVLLITTTIPIATMNTFLFC